MLDDLTQVLSEADVARLVNAFYRRVASDDILGPMYPREDLAGAELRLREFLVYRFGGSTAYLEHRGHPRLRGRHAPFAIDRAAADRWVALMRAALDEVQPPAEARAALEAFFAETATFLINRRGS
jgi:hemoglobin